MMVESYTIKLQWNNERDDFSVWIKHDKPLERNEYSEYGIISATLEEWRCINACMYFMKENGIRDLEIRRFKTDDNG